jgi:hypothetical protein
MRCLRSLCAGVLALVSVVWGASAALGASVDFVPPTQQVTVGTPVQLQVWFYSLPDTLEPASFDIEIGYSSSKLQFNNLDFGDPTLGDQLNQGGSAKTEVLGPYAVNASYNAVNAREYGGLLPAVPAGDFVLATLCFATIAPGLADVWINVIQFLDSTGGAIDPIYAGIGTITIDDLPPQPPNPASAPSTLALFGLGLLLLSALRGRQT